MSHPFKALSAAVLLASLSATSQAMPYSQLIIFGDSLSDSGQFPDLGSPLLGGNPTGGLRFINRTGPTYRGYSTDQILASITAANGSVVDAGGGTIRTRNGYLLDVPRVDPNALFYINGGGNDVLQFVVTDQPDVGLTPAGFVFGFRDAWSSASGLLNDELGSQLAALGGNVIRLNFRALLGEVRGDLATYGFDPLVSQTDVCFSGNGCLADPTWGLGGLTPNPDRLMFNDGVHPTAAVQQISADYIYSILGAPWEVSLLPEMAMASLNGHQQQLRSEWQADRGAWQAVGQDRKSVV